MSKKKVEVTDDDVFREIAIIPGRLSFKPVEEEPFSTPELCCFSIDHDPAFSYYPFFNEFGPPSLIQIHRFYKLTMEILEGHKEPVQFFCHNDAFRFTSAVCYICTFWMLHEGVSHVEAHKPFKRLETCFMPFGDASQLPTSLVMTVAHYLRGFAKGIAMGWYDKATFDEDGWARRAHSESGDMNWLIPNKLMAFASPWKKRDQGNGYKVCLVRDLIEPFKALGINHVVRLNERLYDEGEFKRAGLTHTDLYFDDGSVPPVQIREAWLRIINGKDVVALHCKAGLGRTGTLAGVYMIKKFGFTGEEAIAWIRICRPGSIMGPQQQYLKSYKDTVSTGSAAPKTKKKTLKKKKA